MSLSLGKWPNESTTDRVARIAANFVNMADNLREEKRRELSNWAYYSGINGSQWDSDALALLRKEMRPAHTFNLVQQIVDKMAGIFLQAPFKTVYRPYGDAAGKINLAQELFDFDRSNGNWESEEAKFIVSGLVYRGVGEFYPDYAYSETGDVNWRCINPTPTYLDPFWRSGKICDLRWVCDPRWMSAEDIAEHYGTKSEEILTELRRLKDSSQQFAAGLPIVDSHSAEFYDAVSGRFRVITYCYMDRKQISKVVGIKDNKEVVFPDDATREAALAHRPDEYKVSVEYRKTCRVVTICPGLSPDLVLADGMHPLQLGHVPYFFWSAKDLWGQPHTPVDLMRDAQEVVNKRESTITHVLGTMANNPKLGNAECFDPEQQRRVERGINKPGSMLWVKNPPRGGLKDAIVSLGSDTYPQGVEKDLERARSFILELLPPAARGEASGANQTGAHFVKVLGQALSGLEVANQGIQTIWKERAQSYLAAAKAIYGGIPRRRFNPNSQQEFWTNRIALENTDPNSHYESESFTDESGLTIEAYRENPVEMLDRYDVIVTQSQSGSTVGDQNLQTMQTALQFTQNPIMRSILEWSMVEYLPGLDDAVKKRLKSEGEVWLQFQHAQIDSQLKQLQAPPQAPAGPADASRAPGMGGIPDSAGVAGSETMANNARSPSDMRPR